MKSILAILLIATFFAFTEEKKITYSQPQIEFIRSELYFANKSVDSLSGDHQLVKRAQAHLNNAFLMLEKNYEEQTDTTSGKNQGTLNKKPK